MLKSSNFPPQILLDVLAEDIKGISNELNEGTIKKQMMNDVNDQKPTPSQEVPILYSQEN